MPKQQSKSKPNCETPRANILTPIQTQAQQKTPNNMSLNCKTKHQPKPMPSAYLKNLQSHKVSSIKSNNMSAVK